MLIYVPANPCKKLIYRGFIVKVSFGVRIPMGILSFPSYRSCPNAGVAFFAENHKNAAYFFDIVFGNINLT